MVAKKTVAKKTVAKKKKEVKFYIPQSIKVSYQDYSILFPHDFTDEADLDGLHLGASAEIKISDEPDNQRITEILLHELLHAVDEIYLGCQLEENTIAALAKAWLQVITDNNLGVNTSKIPKVIKIGAFKYKIITNHVFRDTTSNTGGTCDSEQMCIKLGSGDSQNSAYHSDYIKSILFCMLVSAIRASYSIETEDINSVSPKILGNGIYQVLKDNNLEEIIKNNMKVI